MSRSAHVRAQAKVNLFLRILAREASGYHSLETLFARLDLADDVTVNVGGTGRSIDCRGAEVGMPESNLAFRAATAFTQATGWPGSFAIEIEKRIPVGGGLGGGSADAGAVLRALNALAPAPVSAEALLSIAGRLGADVPFLTSGAPLALAWARGDRFIELPALPPRDLALVCFPFGVSSADAFGWVAETRPATPGGSESARLTLAGLRSWDEVSALAGNDFEAEVALRHPAIAEVLRSARASGALMAELTGSGATVIVVPRAGAEVERLQLPAGATLLRTRTAISVEDVRLTG